MNEQLITLTPNPARRERTLARCHARLERLRTQPQTVDKFALGFSGAYLLLVMANALSVLIR